MSTNASVLPFRRSRLSQPAETELKNRVRGVLASMYPNCDVYERRNEARYPYPRLVHLTPVDTNGIASSTDSFVVAGKDLGDGGLSFYHPDPIPHRRAIASFELAPGRWLGLLIDLSWCRFTRLGWYESGGRFLQIVQSPLRQAS
jgi:hypothetical protein